MLEACCRLPVSLQRDLKRARIVLLAADGRSTRSIAKEVGVQPRIVSLWRHRYADHGLEGLKDKPRPGKQPIYTKTTDKRILKLLDKPPPQGFARWTGPLLAEALGDVDVQYVWRFLRSHKIDLAARKSWCESTDPNFTAKAADVVGLYVAPPEKAIVLCVDEKPSIQALERAQGYLKLPNGRALTGQSASAGSVSRVPAADIEDNVVRSLKEYLAGKSDASPPGNLDRSTLAKLIVGIVVHRHRLVVRLKSDDRDEASDRSDDDQSLTIAWQKPPSKRSRRMLLPHNTIRDVRPEQFERRARLISAIARGRRWLDDVVSRRVTTVAELCARERCSVRQVNMTISLAFLAPNLVKAAVEGRLPRGVGVERLRNSTTEWGRQFEALALNPE